MTIKQNGGIFGRNPTFNDVTSNDVTTENLYVYHPTTNQIAKFESGDATAQIVVSDNVADVRIKNTAGKMLLEADPDEGGAGSYLRFTVDGSTAAEFTASGNLAFPSGQGIDFSATSGTGTSELFDDYEEGSHTSSVTVDSGSATLDGSYDTLSYTKIGNTVHVYGALKIATVSSPSGNIRFSLPFASSGLGTGTIHCDNFLALTGKVPQIFINNAQSTFYVSLLDQATGENETAGSVFDATTFFRVSITYKTS